MKRMKQGKDSDGDRQAYGCYEVYNPLCCLCILQTFAVYSWSKVHLDFNTLSSLQYKQKQLLTAARLVEMAPGSIVYARECITPQKVCNTLSVWAPAYASGPVYGQV